MAVRKATAVWEGTLKEGNGKVGLGIGEYPFSFSSRFEDGQGTNPEELLGAAHAGCFSMALGAALERAGFPVTKIETEAHVHLDRTDEGPRVVKIDLITKAQVPNIDEATFLQHAQGAKENCVISAALKGVPEITLNAQLVS
ncbi:MAG: peroxiredoxin [Phototrophicales bacterium]|nr:MAG: peroxiredoxin [Phototrophicales bacterium]